MALYTLPKIYHPDFQDPRKKPVGAVEFDIAYANLIRFALVPQSINKYIDRVSGVHPDIEDPSKLGWRASQLLEFNNIDFVSGAKGKLSYGDTVTTGGDVAIVMRLTKRPSVFNQANFGRIISTKQEFYSTEGFHIGVGGNVMHVRGSGSTVDNLNFGTFADDELFDAIITFIGTEVKLYINGELTDTGTLDAVSSVQREIIVGQKISGNEYAYIGILEYLYLAEPSNIELLLDLQKDPYQILKPQDPLKYFTSSVSSGIAVTGTAVPTQTEADIVTGGKTIILTLSGDTFVTGTSSLDGIAAGSDSDKTGTNKWDALIKTALDNTNVVLSAADTVATITLPAFATYDTAETETITWTIPSASLTSGTSDIIATPTHTVTPLIFTTAIIQGNGNIITPITISKELIAILQGTGNTLTFITIAKELNIVLQANGDLISSFDIDKVLDIVLQGGGTLTSIPSINIDLTALVTGGGNLSAIIDSIVTAIAQISGGGVLTSLGAKANLVQPTITANGIPEVSILKDISFTQNVSGDGILDAAAIKGIALNILESLGGSVLTSIAINKELTSLLEGGTAGLLVNVAKATAISINTEANGLLISQILIDKELGLVTISANGNIFVTHIKDFGDSNTILLNLTSIAEATSRQSSSRSIGNIREEDINANT